MAFEVSTLLTLCRSTPETSEPPLEKLTQMLLMLARQMTPRVLTVVVMRLVVILVPTPQQLLLLLTFIAVIIGTQLSPTSALRQAALMRLTPFMWLSLGPSAEYMTAFVLELVMFMVRPLRWPTVAMRLRPILFMSIRCIMLTVVGAAMCRLLPNLIGKPSVLNVSPTVPLLLRMTMMPMFRTPSSMTLSTMLVCSPLLITVVLLHPIMMAPFATPPTYGSVLNSIRLACLLALPVCPSALIVHPT